MLENNKLSPCPACHIGMSHWIDGLLEGYSHPYTDKTCVLRGVVIHPCYYAQWNALPRHNEPEWLPIKDAPEGIELFIAYWDGYEWGYTTDRQFSDCLFSVLNPEYRFFQIPNPPEVTT